MRFLPVVILAVFFTGCTVNNDLMLKTDKDFLYDPIEMAPDEDYEITPNDILQMRIFTNNGFELVEQTGDSRGNNLFLNQSERITYLVERDGYVKLPVLGRVKLDGYTTREAEFLLEEMLVEYYNEPFVQLEVTNRRVIVFTGNGSTAKVVTLLNENTTLMEALALAGGINARGRANRIKLIRESDDGGDRKVFLIDLSTIDGLEYTDLVVQANDIIYVEPIPDVAQELTRDLAPVLSLLTSALFLYGVIRGFGQ